MSNRFVCSLLGCPVEPKYYIRVFFFVQSGSNAPALGVGQDLKDFTLHVMLCKLAHFEQRNNSRIQISIFSSILPRPIMIFYCILFTCFIFVMGLDPVISPWRSQNYLDGLAGWKSVSAI